MSQRIPNRLARLAAGAFVAGAVAGFIWALLRPHPVSQYRTALREQLAEQGRESSQDVLRGEEALD